MRRRRGCSAGLIGLLLAPATAWAQSFPADPQWTALTQNQAVITDPTSDAQSARDIVGDAANPTAYVYSDGTYLYFRLRVDSDPLQAAPTNYRPFGWACLLDTDGDLQSYEFVAGVDGIANPDTVELRQNTLPTNVGDPSDDAETLLMSYPPISHARSVPAPSNFLGTPDFFIDWAISISDLVAAGVTGQTPLRFICGTSNNARSLVADLISATGATTLPDLASDPILCGPTGCAPACAGAGQACSTGQPGVCAAGTVTCNGSMPQCTPDVGPSSETCDGLDNNCDGAVDDGFNLGMACTEGVGACMAAGVLVCDGAGAATCDATPGSPSAEVCGDGIDNNCDGATDEQCADTDGDGLTDAVEDQLGTDPNDADTDNDGVPDGEELQPGVDTDGDGLINALDPDSDDDGLFDGTELGYGCSGPGTDASLGHCIPDGDGGATTTDPLDADTDDGGVPDGSEDTDRDGVLDAGETNPTAGNGADDGSNQDSDGDGLSDGLEETIGTDPNDADTDNDGVPDGQEPNPADDTDGDGLINGLDPDSDDDGLFDGTEMGLDCSNPDTDASLGHCTPDADMGATTTNPLDADTDDGGVSDGSEDVNLNGAIDGDETNPTAGNGDDDLLNQDSDGDGLSNGLEGTLGTDPNDADSDNDGVPDGQEPNPADDTDGDGTINALDEDADGDGLFDGTEMGFDCSNPDTDPAAGNCTPDADGGATTTNPLDADTDDGGVSDGDEDANHDGAVDPGETDPNDGSDDVVTTGCTDDSECGDATSGMVCDDATQTCVPGCRGEGGNGCPEGEVCSSTDETIGTCGPPPPECTVDADCGGETSGQVCDPATLACIQGCRGADGNSCPIGLECTSTDSAIGTCFAPEGVYVEGSGCVCAARPSQGSGGAWLSLPAALALLAARSRRRRRSQR